ncbi:uncharacterized protein [Patagioenas fasciata]|uniref:uncharacterized protein n=1 Tax=Patagioenas fasciata TaxID=372321 RepID=UPI003A98FE4E
MRSPEAAERKETTERQRGPPAAEVSGARQVSVPAEPGGTVGECEGNGAAKEAAGGAVNARCSADPPAQAGNGTWGAAPGWETRRRPPSPACGRGAGGDSRPGADAGGRAEDVAVRSQPGGCRWLRPPRAGEARLAAWREKGRGSTSRAWTGAAAAGAREVGERLRTAERPELPERKGGEKETGASELLEASWQPPKARAAAVSQPEDPLCPAAGPVEPRTLLAHPGDVSGETPRLGRIAAGTDEDLCVNQWHRCPVAQSPFCSVESSI